MKPIVMHDSLGPPLTNHEIAVVEAELGVPLPVTYAAFLREHNGGHPESSVFRVYDEGPDGSPPSYTEQVLAFFLGKSQDEYNDVRASARFFEGRVPPDLLPIGRDVHGNLICLAVSGPNRGKVYWWWHEEEADEGEPPTYANIYFVANSFADLINSLTELPDDDDEQF